MREVIYRKSFNGDFDHEGLFHTFILIGEGTHAVIEESNGCIVDVYISNVKFVSNPDNVPY